MKKNDNSTVLNSVAVILTILVLVVTWKLILPNYVSNRAETLSLENQIINAQAKIDALDQTSSELSGMDNVYKAITVAVSDDADEANLISELEAIALKNSIVLPAISISRVDPNTTSVQTADSTVLAVPTSASPITISINVNGSFEQLNGLVSALEKSVKFMNIKSLNYSAGEGSTLSLALQIEAYSRQVATDAVAE